MSGKGRNGEGENGGQSDEEQIDFDDDSVYKNRADQEEERRDLSEERESETQAEESRAKEDDTE